MNDLNYVVEKVLSIIRKDNGKKNNDSYDTGTVKRIDGNIAWVQYDEKNPQVTPVVISGASCKKGDKVRIKNNNGTAFILGNDSNPPTDDTKAEHAQATAEGADKIAKDAQVTASEALEDAEHTAQYFWYRDGNDSEAGAHVTQVPQEDFEANPQGGNLLMRTSYIAFRDALKRLAHFGAQDAQIGSDDATNIKLDANGIHGTDDVGNSYFEVNYDSSTSEHGTYTYASVRTVKETVSLEVGQHVFYEKTIQLQNLDQSGTIKVNNDAILTFAVGSSVTLSSLVNCSLVVGSSTGSYFGISTNSHDFTIGTDETHTASFVMSSSGKTYSYQIAIEYDSSNDTITLTHNITCTGGALTIISWVNYDPSIEYPAFVYKTNMKLSNTFSVDADGNVEAIGEHITKKSSLSLGTYITGAMLTNAGSRLMFSIPTGRVYPAGTHISKITFSFVVRCANYNGSAVYIVKSSSGGSSSVSFDSTGSLTFYNGANQQKTINLLSYDISLEGNTNIRIHFDGSNYLFVGNATNNGYLNNMPCIVYLTNIEVTLRIPS